MDAERWRRIQRLFEAALEHEPGAREAWLDEATADDPDLRAEVRSLLAADRGDDRVAAVVAGAAEGALDEPADLGGRLVGRYRIVREIGRGGMGTVYLAERADGQFEQRVAIKVVRERLARPDLVERFRSERQILARLEHPHIARLLDGGTTDEGSPFVVMEHVDGEPLDRYCSERNLGARGRLDLFLGVCDAVHYAHRNLIVHRDLKPSNVLVTGDGVPKLLDFGVARLLDPSGASDDGATRTVARMMTPAYASPEQVRGEPVSTATDVYSLGVVLHELLTGKRPYRGPTTTPAELERAICEEQPQRPGLRGDLDNIVLKALRKEPERRYATAAELADDIRRHLDGLPVLARPSTWAYRSGKFVRRHKLGVAAAALATIGLVGGAVAATVGLVRARAAERVAREEARVAERVSEFMVDLFGSPDPNRAQGREVTAREILDVGFERIDEELGDEPPIQARLMGAMGRAYIELGRHEKAEPLLGRAHELNLKLYGAGDPRSIDSAYDLGDIVFRLNRMERAEALFRQSMNGAASAFGPDDDRTLRAMIALGSTERRLGRAEEAERRWRETLDRARRSLGEEHETTLSAAALVASALRDRGSIEEAEAALRELVAVRTRVSGGDHPATIGATSGLANLLMTQGRYEEAEPLILQTLEGRRRVLGDDHLITMMSHVSLGTLRERQQRFEEAATHFRRVYEAYRDELGEDYIYTIEAKVNLGEVEATRGRTAEAEALLADAAARALSVEPPDDRYALHALRAYTEFLTAAGRDEEAAPLQRELERRNGAR